MCEYQKLYSFFHKALLVTAQRFALPAGRIGKNLLILSRQTLQIALQILGR